MTLDTIERITLVGIAVALIVAAIFQARWLHTLETRANAQDERITALGGEIIAGYDRVITCLTDMIDRLSTEGCDDCQDCDDETMGATGNHGGAGTDPAHVMAGKGRADLRGESVDVSDVLDDRPAEDGASASVIATCGTCVTPMFAVPVGFTDRSDALMHGATTGHRIDFVTVAYPNVTADDWVMTERFRASGDTPVVLT